MPNVSNYTEQGGETTVIGGTLNVTGTFKTGGVAVTSTAAELNITDVSAQTETILVAGAVSVVKRITNLSAASGAYAVTLAAPNASMLGQIKVIQMTVAGNAITIALTQVLGGSAANTASFDGVNETLTLLAGVNKWIVLDEHGVTLS